MVSGNDDGGDNKSDTEIYFKRTNPEFSKESMALH